jgi:hypothetical protein
MMLMAMTASRNPKMLLDGSGKPDCKVPIDCGEAFLSMHASDRQRAKFYVGTVAPQIAMPRRNV